MIEENQTFLRSRFAIQGVIQGHTGVLNWTEMTAVRFVKPRLPADASAPVSAARLPAFDHVRALGVLLVLLLHTLTPYVTHKMPLLVWPVLEPVGSPLLDALFWWIECFVMPLFLLLSGFVAGRLLQRKSRVEFFRHRKRRLLFPLLAAMVFVLPVDLYVWAAGLVLHGGFPVKSLLTLKFNDYIDRNLWGLSHLWYLEYVFLYCFLLTAGWRLYEKQPVVRAVIRKLEPQNHWAKVFFLAMAGVGLLYWEPNVVIAFQHRPWPVPSKFLYSGLFFVGGYWLQRASGSLEWLQKWGPVSCLGALVAFSFALPLIHQQIGAGNQAGQQGGMCLAIVLTAWGSCLGMMGCFLRYLNRPVAWLGYVAAASFWVYLVHHPIVGIVHILLAFVSWPLLLKGILAWTVTIFLTIGSYELMIRNTKTGRWLNGSGGWRQKPVAPESETPRSGVRQAA